MDEQLREEIESRDCEIDYLQKALAERDELLRQCAEKLVSVIDYEESTDMALKIEKLLGDK